MTPAHAEHFESAEQQAHAARLGMWVFLASELLLFAGLFALYAGYRAHWPDGFKDGIAHATKWPGALNTILLLTSSTLAALAVEAGREGRRLRACLLLGSTMLLGVAFFTIKLLEYRAHFAEGIYPGGAGSYLAHAPPGASVFWTLYFVSTGLHAVHVLVGIIVLGMTAIGLLRGRLAADRSYVLENAVLYWHLIDLIWIFLWPLYYLA